MSTPIVRGHHPEPIVRIQATRNGVQLEVTASAAASMIVVGDAELVGEPDGAAQEALDAAITAQRAVHAIARRER